MPNWTFNEITTNNPAIITNYMTNGNFDFEKLIPMPKSLDVTDGSITNIAIAYYLSDRLTKTAEECGLHQIVYSFFQEDLGDKLIAGMKDDPEFPKKWHMTEDELYDLGKTYMGNLKNYGAKTWYNWRLDHWGCKWNAGDTSVSMDGLSVSFTTPWSAPFPIFKALCNRHPDAEITFYSEYEEGDVIELKNDHGALFAIGDASEWL